MAKGSKIVPVRIPEKLFGELVAAMEAANLTRREEPYVVSTYLRHCLVAKLDHLDRSRKKSRAKKATGRAEASSESKGGEV